MFHLGVGRSQIEWETESENSNFSFPMGQIGQNDHSNPYIESTTVLSDILFGIIIYLYNNYNIIVLTRNYDSSLVTNSE